MAALVIERDPGNKHLFHVVGFGSFEAGNRGSWNAGFGASGGRTASAKKKGLLKRGAILRDGAGAEVGVIEPWNLSGTQCSVRLYGVSYEWNREKTFSLGAAAPYLLLCGGQVLARYEGRHLFEKAVHGVVNDSFQVDSLIIVIGAWLMKTTQERLQQQQTAVVTSQR